MEKWKRRRWKSNSEVQPAKSGDLPAHGDRADAIGRVFPPGQLPISNSQLPNGLNYQFPASNSQEARCCDVWLVSELGVGSWRLGELAVESSGAFDRSTSLLEQSSPAQNGSLLRLSARRRRDSAQHPGLLVRLPGVSVLLPRRAAHFPVVRRVSLVLRLCSPAGGAFLSSHGSSPRRAARLSRPTALLAVGRRVSLVVRLCSPAGGAFLSSYGSSPRRAARLPPVRRACPSFCRVWLVVRHACPPIRCALAVSVRDLQTFSLNWHQKRAGIRIMRRTWRCKPRAGRCRW